MLKQLLCSAALVTMAISASADSKVLWQSEDPAGKLVGWGDPALTLSAEEAASIKAGDYLTMTVAGVDPENGWPQVALFEGNVGWPPAMNEGVGGKEYPYVATFGVTMELADKIHANGVVFKGDGAYVSAVGLEEGTIAVGPNTVWFGPKQCNWGNPVSINKEVFANVAPYDKIVVEYDKSAPEHTLQFLFGGWGGVNIPSYEAWKTDFLTNDEEAGAYTIELKPSLTNLLWGEEGNEQEYDLFTLLKNDGLLMHGPCLVNQVLYIKGNPEYPEKLNFTLNGKEELPGITVTQEMEPYDGDDYLTVKITGKSEADEITLDMATPEGWDGMMVYSSYDGETAEINPLQAKAPVKEGDDYWMPLSFAGWLTPGNTITLPVDGEEWTASAYLVKDEQVYMINIDFIFDVEPIVPKYPESIEFTLNGNKGLEGVTVRQEKDAEGALKIDVTGKSVSEKITMDFETPAGWTGMLIMDAFGFGEIKQNISKVATETISLESAYNMGFKKGNEITYDVDGEYNYAQIALYKGNEVYLPFVDFTFEVGKEIVNPAIPESIDITTFVKGLKVDQERDEEDGSIYIDITGTIAEEEFDVVLDVPEGWDGFVTLPYSEGITVGDYQEVSPRKIGAYDHDWVSLEDALAEGYVKGNKLTIKASGNYEFAFTYLYKGDQMDYNAYIGITAKVNQGEPDDSEDLIVKNQAAYDAVILNLDALLEKYEAAVADIKEKNPDFDFSMYEEIPSMIEETKQYAEMALNAANEDGAPFSEYFYGSVEEIEGFISMMLMEADPAPEFPSTFDVTLSNNAGIEMTTDDSQGVFIITVTGKSAEQEITVTVAVPEGFDGFMHMSDLDMMDPGIGGGPLSTRSEEPEWYPISWVLEEGMKVGNTMTFPVDGQNYAGQFYPCKHGLVDINNQINVEFEVEYDPTVGVSVVNAAENATYYDLQGNKIAKPANGIYVKVVDGKATKVAVK
ncbi:MAG: hypothetical protein K2I08_10970 [Muribaculaceae bacterium]|nr:hypothetical protein [Muribaculaceae bacterium]